MPAPYDPTAGDYADEKPVRDELSAALDVCHGCRRCIDRCELFPTLFDLLDDMAEPKADRLTPAAQDRLVDLCFHCGLCAVDCPYTPGRHEAAVDVPGLMLRAEAMRRRNGHHSIRRRVTTWALGRTDRIGRAATRRASVNRIVNAAPGSAVRRVVRAVAGISAHRRLVPYSRHRFSAWFAQGARPPVTEPRARVTVVPTCLVEYRHTEIGADLVAVYERNGVECSVSAMGCCGAPWLYAGEIDRFSRVARRNVRVLAEELRAGGDLVVPQPTCSHVIRRHYPTHVGGLDADLVAAHVFDASEYLVDLHRSDGLDTDFRGDVPQSVTYHAACHLRTQGIGLPGRELIELAGVPVTVVDGSSTTESRWGLRAEHDSTASAAIRRLGSSVEASGGEVVVGDCELANVAIGERAGRTPVHPLQVLARAYGAVAD